MSRQVSAEELSIRYMLKHELLDFTDEMKNALFANIEEKGDSWKTCNKEYLVKKLEEHLKLGHWVSVANFCFMLHYRENNFEKVGTSNLCAQRAEKESKT